MVLDLESLTVKLGSAIILDGVSVRFDGGSLGLLGPNGAGKTTLLRTLLGFIAPAGGRALVLGFNAAKEPLEVRQRIGFMPENDCHIPGLNGVGFVAYAGQLAGMTPKDALERAHEVLHYVGLGEARYRKVETYSTGMKQRIKLGQALVHDPGLLFLDEPTNGLDPKGRAEMLELIRDISSRKSIHVVLSSHLLPDVESVCRELLVIHRGRRVAAGRIDELKRNAGPVFECRVAGDVESFRRELAERGCRFLESEDGTMRIQMGEGLSSRVLVRAAADTHVQLRHLRPLEQSLEDVFLSALESH